ncbi:hypothetical protein RIF29_39501 [Crotalaria pallida]|uniref:Uncharacterized protein n=1 Tax=Crotalaria pallida TaxID=3830 RepID=A0AAN9E2Z8_CROPI
MVEKQSHRDRITATHRREQQKKKKKKKRKEKKERREIERERERERERGRKKTLTAIETLRFICTKTTLPHSFSLILHFPPFSPHNPQCSTLQLSHINFFLSN